MPKPDAITDLLGEIFVAQERLTRDEIQRAAVAADLPAEVMTRVDALPEGEYALDEAAEVLRAEQPDDDPDFASEHDDTTVGPDVGAAGDDAPEPESPRGLGGGDYDRA
ncbi:MAG TPA: hypothetical protein VHI50_09475 [Micromonosporaceae bacterium]|jgi:hypothetical protein|nr:hypothetical protein [Micromonosporaceae bacterium]